MSILGKIFGGPAIDAVTAIGGVVDELFTSDEEKAQGRALMAKIAQKPHILQGAVNKVQASHRSIFVAGGRPFLFWVAGICLAFFYIPQYSVAAWVWSQTVLTTGEMVPYPVDADGIMELVLALLGLGGLRTIEKMNGRAK